MYLLGLPQGPVHFYENGRGTRFAHDIVAPPVRPVVVRSVRGEFTPRGGLTTSNLPAGPSDTLASKRQRK